MLRRRGPLLSSPVPIFSSLFFSSSYSSCKRTPPSLPPLRPPVPKRIPFAASVHGRTWKDPYRWMSNTDDPDLLDHLNRKNAYAEAFMADTRDLQRRLVAEMKSRMPPKISTPPEKWGPWSAPKPSTLLPFASPFCPPPYSEHLLMSSLQNQF